MFSNNRKIVSSIGCVPLVFFNSAFNGSACLSNITFARVALNPIQTGLFRGSSDWGGRKQPAAVTQEPLKILQ